MRVEAPSAAEILTELKLLLGNDQLPVQQEVARAAGVHQSLVSRALSGQLRRVTGKVNALLEYARSRAGADAALLAAKMARGMTTTVASTTRKTERKSDPRSAPEVAAESYRRQARDGIETYLSDGYDPRLLVEQLAVLRRAQRLRRPGKNRSTTERAGPTD